MAPPHQYHHIHHQYRHIHHRYRHIHHHLYHSDVGREASPDYSSSSDVQTDSSLLIDPPLTPRRHHHHQHQHKKGVAASSRLSNGQHPPASRREGGEMAAKDLLKLITWQKEQVKLQQQELEKYDLDIQFKEKREREYQRHCDLLHRETERQEKLEQGYVVEEGELAQRDMAEELRRAQAEERGLRVDVNLVKCRVKSAEKEIEEKVKRQEKLLADIEKERSMIEQQEEQQKVREEEAKKKVDETEKKIKELEKTVKEVEDETVKVVEEVEKVGGDISERKASTKTLLEEIRKENMDGFQLTEKAKVGSMEGLDKIGIHLGGSNRKMNCDPVNLADTVPSKKNPNGVWV